MVCYRCLYGVLQVFVWCATGACMVCDRCLYGTLKCFSILQLLQLRSLLLTTCSNKRWPAAEEQPSHSIVAREHRTVSLINGTDADIQKQLLLKRGKGTSFSLNQ